MAIAFSFFSHCATSSKGVCWKNISIEALMYPGQLLNAEQYARWCEYQYAPDPSITSIICKIEPATVMQSLWVMYQSIQASTFPLDIWCFYLPSQAKDYLFWDVNGQDEKDKIVTLRMWVMIFKLYHHTVKKWRNYYRYLITWNFGVTLI